MDGFTDLVAEWLNLAELALAPARAWADAWVQAAAACYAAPRPATPGRAVPRVALR